MSLGIWQLVLILAIVVLLFGRGRIAGVMGDFGKGVRSLREGLKGEEDAKADADKRIASEEKNEDKTIS